MLWSLAMCLRLRRLSMEVDEVGVWTREWGMQMLKLRRG